MAKWCNMIMDDLANLEKYHGSPLRSPLKHLSLDSVVKHIAFVQIYGYLILGRFTWRGMFPVRKLPQGWGSSQRLKALGLSCASGLQPIFFLTIQSFGSHGVKILTPQKWSGWALKMTIFAGSPRVWNRVSDFNTKRMIGGGSAPVTRSGTTKGNIMFLSSHIDMDCSLGFNGNSTILMR